MSAINLTPEEWDVLEGFHTGKYDPFNMPEDKTKAAVSVIDKAEAYCTETDSFDEIGFSLAEWFYNRYLEEKSKEA